MDTINLAGCSNIVALCGMFPKFGEGDNPSQSVANQINELKPKFRAAICTTNSDQLSYAGKGIKKAGGYCLEVIHGNHGPVWIWIIPGNLVTDMYTPDGYKKVPLTEEGKFQTWEFEEENKGKEVNKIQLKEQPVIIIEE